MKWLHLSDLHLGRRDSASQATALKELVGAATEAIGTATLDAIIVTGDVANAGRTEQYDEFGAQVLNPLRSLPSCKDALVIAVPGNHDLDGDASTPLVWSAIGAERQRLFFEESVAGQKIREHRARSFAAFTSFCAREGIVAPNPATEVTRLFDFRAPTSGTQVRAVLATTSFFSNREADLSDRDKAPWPTDPVRSRLLTPGTPELTLVLGHHPVHWFRQQDHDPCDSLFDSKGALYLHGHTHQIEARYGPSGLLSLGFGAAYQSSLPELAVPYRNSFALCELAGEHLDVLIVNWDAHHARWVPGHELPAGFKTPSELRKHAYSLKLNVLQRRLAFSPPSETRPRVAPRITDVLPLDTLTADDWRRLIIRLNFLNPPVQSESELVPIAGDGTAFFRTVHSERDYVRCIPGVGHVLSKAEIESANQSLDYDEHRSHTLVLFGSVSEDGRTAYLRLKRKKALRVIDGAEVAAQLRHHLSREQSAYLAQLDASRHSVTLLLSQDKLFLLVVDRLQQATFCVVGSSGEVTPMAHPAVVSARRLKPALENSEYGSVPASGPQAAATASAFDRIAYLEACNREFASARYTALAAIGVRLPDLPLDELYVAATADVGHEAAASATLSRAIDDMLQGLQLDAPLRADIEAQLKKRLGIAPLADCGAARTLYQRHGSAAILGDPGSGKTCFVKYEILEYCRHGRDDSSWYGKHLPLFVPLSEAARIFGKNTDLVETASILCARRGLPIALSDVREYASQGRLAFFFDGLDEIVSLDQRAAIVAAISEVMATLVPAGNRVILTSRPAAIQLVELPESLTTLHLRGLTEDEMRVLATRVLAARVSENSVGMRLDETQLTEKDHSVIRQLLADVGNIPGIRRLATNPLLLTLLIMIYANSGSPSAKRHRVYHQAVQTLVSVRSRASGQRPLSEADLRARLGAVAVAVFQDPDGAIPTRAAVEAEIKRVMETERASTVSDAEVSEFLQTLATATGLIVLNDSQGDGAATITFMHHSFLEYYAAQGLKSRLDSGEVAKLALQPRWREVVTLLAGLISDEGDISPLIEELLVEREEADKITLERLLFAFDCALESEVPPDRAQRALFRALDAALRQGPAKYDPELRRKVGDRVARLAGATASERLTQFLVAGLRDADAAVCAAFVDLVGHGAVDLEVSEVVLEALDSACERDETEVLVAVCEAIGRARALRRPKAEEALNKALARNVTTKMAAVRAVEAAPALAASRWDKLVEAMRQDQVFIASSAARALVLAGLRIDTDQKEDRRLLLDVLRTVQSDGESIKDIAISCSRREIDRGLSANDVDERLIAIRLMPWLRGEEQYVHDSLMGILRLKGDDRREEVVAALNALPLASGAHKLLRVYEVDEVRAFLTAKTRDVRVAACRALSVVGCSPSTVSQVGTALLDFLGEQTNGPEFRVGVRALARCAADFADAREWLFAECERRIDRGDITDTPRAEDLVEVLRACRALDGGASEALCTRLMNTSGDYKATELVRREACRAVASICRPSVRVVNYFIGQLEARPPRLGDSIAAAVLRFVERARRRIEFVKALTSKLDALETAVLGQYLAVQAELKSHGDVRLSELRRAVEEIQQVLRSYREFAQLTSA